METKGFIRRSFSSLMRAITFARLLLVNLIFVVVVIALISLFSAAKLPSVPDRGALVLDLNGALVEQLSYADPLALLMGGADQQQRETPLQDVIDAIHYAKDDDRINSLVLKLDNLSYGGISKMQEIATALENFRATDKRIIAVADHYNQDQYWLAAQADEVYIHPLGGVSLEGYGVYRSYYKKALDDLRVKVHVFRVGEFKSAMEPYMRNNMSSQARESNLLWLNSLWSQYVEGVAQRRELTSSHIEQYIVEFDKLLVRHDGDSAVAALEAGLVDGIKARDEMAQYLAEVVGEVDSDGHYAAVKYREYLWLRDREFSQLQSADRIGLIKASGTIVDGEQPSGMIGGDSLADLIRIARLDSDIKAVVLRVDSGGGSMFASEIIRRELEILKKSGKPLIVSMGSLAASGGYWISALADEIWATPTTLTGSIGIFGAFPTIDMALAELGISNDGVGTTLIAGAMRVDRPLAPTVERSIQTTIEHGYKRFIEIVAEGRLMEKSAVEKIASGRVWSGKDALRIGLVDNLGGLQEAIVSAAALANLDDYTVRDIELPISTQEQLLRELMGNVWVKKLLVNENRESFFKQLQSIVGPLSGGLAFIRTMNDPKGIYLQCTACAAL